MNVEKITRQPWFMWAALGLLAGLCTVLGVLQYGWIGEISRAERARLRENLRTSLESLSRSFNTELATASAALIPTAAQVAELGREEAYASRYRQWAAASGAENPVFRRVALAIPSGSRLEFRELSLESGEFRDAAWPTEWEGVRARLEARMNHQPVPPATDELPVAEFPRFEWRQQQQPGPPQRMAEQEWLIVEFDRDELATRLVPRLLQRYLSTGGELDYDAEVLLRSDPSVVLYTTTSDRGIGSDPDGAIALFEPLPMEFLRRPGPGPGLGSGPGHGEFDRRFESKGSPGGFGRSFRGPGRARWLLVVRHKDGSLEAIVAGARQRHIAVSGAILLLILASVSMLVRLSRRAHVLAENQMNFVAGVSHELRTPLTVIRTAAYSLKNRFSNDPAQVIRYGGLIEEESRKLTALIEQVMRYAGAESGRVIRDREPLAVESLLEQSVESSRAELDEAGVTVESRVEPGMPLVLGDAMALKHAIQNLIENALKHGGGGNWIGVTAKRVSGAGPGAIEIRVADRGPGIPREEQEHIFDPFYRGQRALQDQVRGTGLGLNLVKKIVEAHGGAIRVNSEPDKGAEFVVRIPAAPPELQDEFAHSLS